MKGSKEITNEIIEKLRQGTIPWRQTWKAGLPANAVTRKPYRGVNVWLLNTYEYHSNLWLTFNQAKLMKGCVKRGEHGRQIVFWKLMEVEDEETEEVETIPLLRTYTVFNVEQTTVKLEAEARVVEPIMSAQEIVDGFRDCPVIEHGRPAYNPARDTITMPILEAFDAADEFYATLFHELSHSTGHPTRLNRSLSTLYGTDQYAEEEVVAEMSASYLCAMAGTEVHAKTISNSVSYIHHWIQRFRENEKLIIHLSAYAQRACDWILGKKAATDAITSEDVAMSEAAMG